MILARNLVRHSVKKVFSLDMLQFLNDNFLPYDKVYVWQTHRTCSMLLSEVDGSRKLAVSNLFSKNVV